MIEQLDSIEKTSSFMFEDLKIDAKNNVVSKGQTETTIEPRLMRIIVKLAQKSGQIVERTELLKEISENAYVSDESLTQAISKIRHVLGDNTRQPKFIKTIPRKGYVLLASASLISDSNIDTARDLVPSNTVNTKRLWWAQINLHSLIIGLCLVIVIGVALAFWWPDQNEFIEKGEIEFIEKER
jgi:DNA-binding winged helix-turn-helix (wHTH) protein